MRVNAGGHEGVAASYPRMPTAPARRLHASPLIAGLERWAVPVAADAEVSSTPVLALGTAPPPAPQWHWALALPRAMQPTAGTGAWDAGTLGCGASCGELPICSCHFPGAEMSPGGVLGVSNASWLSPGRRYAAQVTAKDPTTGATAAAEIIVTVESSTNGLEPAASIAFASPLLPEEFVILASPGSFVTITLSVRAAVAATHAASVIALPHVAIWPPQLVGLGRSSDCPASAPTAVASAGPPSSATSPPAASGACSVTIFWAVDVAFAGRTVPLCFYAVAVALNVSGMPGGYAMPWPLLPLARYSATGSLGNVTGADARCFFVTVSAIEMPAAQAGAGYVLTASPSSDGSSHSADDPMTLGFFDWAQGTRFTHANAVIGPAGVSVLSSSTPALVVTGSAAVATSFNNAITFPYQPSSFFTITNGSVAAAPSAQLPTNVGPSFWASRPAAAALGFTATVSGFADAPGVLESIAIVLTASHGPHRLPDFLDITTTLTLLQSGAAAGNSDSPTLRALRDAAAFSGAFAVLQPLNSSTLVNLVACNASVVPFTPACILSTAVIDAVSLDDGATHTIGLAFKGAQPGFSIAVDTSTIDFLHSGGPWMPPPLAYLGVAASFFPPCRGGRCADASVTDAVAGAYLAGLLTNDFEGESDLVVDVGAGVQRGAYMAFRAVPAQRSLVFFNASFIIQACNGDASFVEWIDSGAIVVDASPGSGPAAVFRFHCRDDAGVAIDVRASPQLQAAITSTLWIENPGWRVAVLGPASLFASDVDAVSIVEGSVLCATNCDWQPGKCVLLALRFGTAVYPTVWQQPESWAPVTTDAPLNDTFVSIWPAPSLIEWPIALTPSSALCSCIQRSDTCPLLAVRAGDSLLALLVPSLGSRAPYRSFSFDAFLTATLGTPSMALGALPTSMLALVVFTSDNVVLRATPAVALQWTAGIVNREGVALPLAIGVNGNAQTIAQVYIRAGVPSAVHSYVTLCNNPAFSLALDDPRTCDVISPITSTPSFDGGCVGRDGVCVGAALAVAGANVTAFFVLRDAFGNLVNASAPVVAGLNFSMTLGSEHRDVSSVLVPGRVGGYAAMVLALTESFVMAGTFNIACTLDGDAVQLSPLNLVVVAGSASATGSRIVVDDCAPFSHTWAGMPGKVHLLIADAFGNAIADLAGVRDLDISVVSTSALDNATMSLASLGGPFPGWYALQYSSTRAGWYSVRGSIDGMLLAVGTSAASCSGPAAVVPQRTSPSDHVYIAALLIDPLTTIAVLSDATYSLQAGLEVCLAYFVPRDSLRNPRILPPASGDIFFADAPLTVAPPALAAFNDGLAGDWVVSRSLRKEWGAFTPHHRPPSKYSQSPSPGLRILSEASSWASNVTLRSNGSAVLVCLIPVVCGRHNLSISVVAPIIAEVAGSPLDVSVVSGQLDPANCVVSGAIAGGIPGYPLPISVVARDAYSNTRSGGFDDSFFLSLDASAPADVNALPPGSIVQLFAATSDSAAYNGSYTFSLNGSAGVLFLSVLAQLDSGLVHVAGSPFSVFRGSSVLPATVIMTTSGNAPTFHADAFASINLQLLYENGSTFMLPSTQLAAVLVEHTADAALAAFVPTASLARALPGTATSLTYLGDGAYSLQYGCDAALTGICSAGGLANIVVALNNIRMRPADVGIGSDAALVVDSALGHAGSAAIFLNATLAQAGGSLSVNATLALASGFHLLNGSSPSLLFSDWLGHTLTPRGSLGMVVTPLNSGPHWVCVRVIAPLGIPRGSFSSQRFYCANSNATNLTLLPDPLATYVTAVTIRGAFEVVVGDAFTLSVTLLDFSGVFPDAPLVNITLLRLCTPSSQWSCAVPPTRNLLCDVALAAASPTPRCLVAGTLEYSASFAPFSASIAGCHWVSV